MTPNDFIAAIGPSAQVSMVVSKIPASFTIAQSALESRWGTSQLFRQAMNIFGVKADPSWSGPTVSMHTVEYIHGQAETVPALWRRYSSWQECMDDHAAFLHQNERYAAAFLCTDGQSFAQAIAAAGYATDPRYGDKLCTIIDVHNLENLDRSPT